jgi:hypothetical protein
MTKKIKVLRISEDVIGVEYYSESFGEDIIDLYKLYDRWSKVYRWIASDISKFFFSYMCFDPITELNAENYIINDKILQEK